MKLGNIVNPAFQMAFRKLSNQEVPLRAAFQIKGVAKQIQEQITQYDASRVDALKRLGNTDEKGELEQDDKGNVKLSDDNMKKFADELQSLAELEVSVSSIKISDLGANVRLTTADLAALDELIVE